jgi:acetyl-CoA synthetase
MSAAQAGDPQPNLLNENRRFEPLAEFARNANVTGAAYEEAGADRLGFWARQAERLSWARRWDAVLDWSAPPFAKWFAGGRLNVAYNCVDRHVEAGHGSQVAYFWEGEPGETRAITYAELQDEVCKAANALTSLGVTSGDRVAIYLPMIPETVIAMLACARLGAPHTVVFGGFSAAALSDRILDCDARVVITADGGFRRGEPFGLKRSVDEALAQCPDVRSVLVVRRTGQEIDWTHGRDAWWHDVVGSASPEHTAEAFDAEHPLFIMYTSGTTGKPKGILHTCGGYLTQAAWTHWAVFDIKPDSDLYWCGADIGWITGHSYIVYGPLANRTTSFLYEGVPNNPDEHRWWQMIERYKITILYTAPTTIRTFMKWGREIPAAHDLSSLRLLGSVGEPINPEAWMWYRKNIGGDRCPIVDTWWQTETGAIMVSPLPGATTTKPGSATRPLPGIGAGVVDEKGKPAPAGGSGLLVLTEPWPSMARGIWGDPGRFKATYWEQFATQGFYFAGDGAREDDGGDLWLLGRVDDVMNVSGHRISTIEVESALVSHPAVAEAAVAAAPDPTTGQAIVAFVILRGGVREGPDTVTELRDHVAAQIGAIAKPRQIFVVPELPKTRSGKIMRRLLRDVAQRRELGDVTTLADSSVMDRIGEKMPAGPGEDRAVAAFEYRRVPPGATLRMAIILGSTRPRRNGKAVADWVHGRALGRGGAHYDLIDLRDHFLPHLDEPLPASFRQYVGDHTKAWSATIGAYDGFIFVTPEYNHSTSGVLKNAIDHLFVEWSNKAAGFVGYGSVGGARAVEHLRGIASGVNLAHVRQQVNLSLLSDFDGPSFQPRGHHEAALETLFGEVERWACALRTVRDALDSSSEIIDNS